MEIPEHKWLDQIQEHWPIIAGVLGFFSLIVAKAWSYSKRIVLLERSDMVTGDKVDDLAEEIRNLDRSNREQHDNIMKTILELHKK